MDWGVRTDGAWRGSWCREVDVGCDFGEGSLFVGCYEWHFAIL